VGLLTERFSDSLCTIDAIDEESAQQISELLAEAETRKKITAYETIMTR